MEEEPVRPVCRHKSQASELHTVLSFVWIDCNFHPMAAKGHAREEWIKTVRIILGYAAKQEKMKNHESKHAKEEEGILCLRKKR